MSELSWKGIKGIGETKLNDMNEKHKKLYDMIFKTCCMKNNYIIDINKCEKSDSKNIITINLDDIYSINIYIRLGIEKHYFYFSIFKNGEEKKWVKIHLTYINFNNQIHYYIQKMLDFVIRYRYTPFEELKRHMENESKYQYIKHDIMKCNCKWCYRIREYIERQKRLI
jgi:hypothetical protein